MPIDDKERRGIYLDHSQRLEIEAMAAAHKRTISSELAWLTELGMRARHLLGDEAAPVDEGAARMFAYWEIDTVAELDGMVVEMNDALEVGGHRWTFSGLVRELATIGMRVEHLVARSLDAAIAKAQESTPSGELAELVASLIAKPVLELVELQSTPPADVLTRWGSEAATRWWDVVGIALECRGRLDGLTA